MWRWYFARKLWKYRALSIILGGTISGAVFTLLACISLSEQPAPELHDGKRPDLIISGPFGTYEIYGAKEWLDPVVRQGRMMNKIEALENHSQFPELSPNPEDYLR